MFPRLAFEVTVGSDVGPDAAPGAARTERLVGSGSGWVARIGLGLWLNIWLGICLNIWLGLLGGCSAKDSGAGCPSGALIATESCRLRCESDGDCLAPAICDEESQSCRTPAIACEPELVSPAGPVSPGPCAQQEECDLLSRTCVKVAGASCRSSADCRLGETCPLPGPAAGSGTLDSRCVPSRDAKACRRDAECPIGAVCRPVLDAETGAPRTVCGPPLGPSEAGAACRASTECQSGLCLRTGTCFGGCTADTATADCHKRTGVVCGAALVELPGAPSPQGQGPRFATLPSCALSPASCRTDGDCESGGGTCQLLADPRSPTRLITGCLPPRGSGRLSEPCRVDGDCASGLCLGTHCFTACGTTTDCRPGMACRAIPVQVDQVQSAISACAPGRPCTSSQKCLAADEACAPQPVDGGLQLLCTPGRGKPTGGGCRTGADCQSGLCSDRGLCVGGCGSDGDCPRGPLGELELCRPGLVRAADRSATLNICQVAMPPCQRDGDCKLSLTSCRPYQSLDDATRVTPGCGPVVNLGKAAPGAACAADGDCASGRCQKTAPRVCFGICKLDGDCASGRRCYPDFAWHLTSGIEGQPTATYDATSSCAPDLGSRRACTGDGSAADCPMGELCVAVPDAQQNGWFKRCQKAAGAKTAGSSCADDPECQSGRCQIPVGGSVRRCIGLCSTTGPLVCGAGTVCRAGSLEVRPGRSAALTYCQ